MKNTTITSAGKPAILLETKDLRIGNILRYKGELVYVTMLSLDIDDEYEEQIFFCKIGESSNEKGGWNRAICGDLEPVPLEEMKDMYFSFAENFRAELREGIVRVEQYSEGTEYLQHITYIHQYQNLVFALTGTETIVEYK